jgi:hypothetical protein
VIREHSIGHLKDSLPLRQPPPHLPRGTGLRGPDFRKTQSLCRPIYDPGCKTARPAGSSHVALVLPEHQLHHITCRATPLTNGTDSRSASTVYARVEACCRLKSSDCKTLLPLFPLPSLRNPRWDHVRSTKFDQPLAANQHVSRIRPLLEDDLVAIIATLHESTAAVEKQTDSFQRHRDDQLLDTSKRQPRTFERTKRDLIGPIRRKDALELQQLWFAVSTRQPSHGGVSFVFNCSC